MDQLTALLQDRWYLIVGALVVLYIAIKLIKTAIKWVVVIAIAAAVIFYGSSYMNEIKDKVNGQALQVIAGGAKDATYKKNADESYTISIPSKNITMEGRLGSNDVKVTILGQTVTLKIDQTIQTFIDQAKQVQ